MNPDPLRQEGYDFMAAAFDVHSELGHGYTEEIYQEALEVELRSRGIPFVPQAELSVLYKGRALRKRLRPDLLVFGDIIVELKAASSLTTEHEAQLLNHLKATGKPVGYLVNFGSRDKLEWKRFARTRGLSAP
jgi:GxxExxY protein